LLGKGLKQNHDRITWNDPGRDYGEFLGVVVNDVHISLVVGRRWQTIKEDATTQVAKGGVHDGLHSIGPDKHVNSPLVTKRFYQADNFFPGPTRPYEVDNVVDVDERKGYGVRDVLRHIASLLTI
jgi:hypothetical protein